MAVDDQVRELLRTVTPQPPVAIDPTAVTTAARRRHRRRVTLVALPAVAALTALAMVGTALVTGRSDRPEPPADHRPVRTEGWHRIPDLPLSPRWMPFVAWTGGEALVVGGSDIESVGGPAPMPTLKDGAAYDPDTNAWRPIASAPDELSSYDTEIVAGDTVVVAHWNHFLAYDLADDSWRRLPDPPTQVSQPTFAFDGKRVYVLDLYVDEGQDAPVQVLDPATDTWTTLPASPHRPRLDQRTLVWTSAGLVVVGDDFRPRQAGNEQEDAHAELWDGSTWTRYADSGVLGCCWHWTGERVISTTRRTRRDSDLGGLHQYRAVALDPETGRWSTLPWPPGPGITLLQEGWPVADGPLVFSGGYLYDDADGSSTPVDPPDPDIAGETVVLGGHALLMFGGYEYASGAATDRVRRIRPTTDAWEIDFPHQG
jgi:hypothetical protein